MFFGAAIGSILGLAAGERDLRRVKGGLPQQRIDAAAMFQMVNQPGGLTITSAAMQVQQAALQRVIQQAAGLSSSALAASAIQQYHNAASGVALFGASKPPPSISPEARAGALSVAGKALEVSGETKARALMLAIAPTAEDK